MKNVYKVTGLIVLIAIAGLLCAACNLFGGGIPVKVRAYDNKGNAPANLSMVHAAVRGNGGPLLAVTDTESFKPLDTLYDLLGEPEETFTPTSFNVWFEIDAILSDTTRNSIVSEHQYDFTKGLTVDIGNVPSGVTVTGLKLRFGDYIINGSPTSSPVSFEKDGSTITKPMWELALVPRKIPESAGDASMALQEFVYYGDTRMFLPNAVQSDVPGLDNSNIEILTPTEFPYLVVPFEEKVISSGSRAVTLHISWDLTDIIGDYGESQHYRYRLTKGWWNNLYVYASVE